MATHATTTSLATPHAVRTGAPTRHSGPLSVARLHVGGRTCAAASLAALIVLPLGVADGGYFGRSFTAMTVALGATTALAQLLLPRRTLSRGPVVMGTALALLTGWVALSGFWADPGAAVELETRRCLLYVAALCAVWSVVDRRTRPWFLLAITVGISGLLAVGLGMRVVSGAPLDPYYGSLLAEPVGYPNAVGVLAAIGVVLAVGLAPSLGSGARAVQALAAVLVLALGLSGSRGGALALVVGIGVLLALSTADDRWAFAGRAASALVVGGGAWATTVATGGAGAPLVIAAVAAATIGAATPAPSRRGVLLLAGGLALAAVAVAAQHPPSTTSSFRTAYWAAALAEARERPLLGSGAGSYALSWREHRTVETDVRDAHSLYVETLSELGPIGLGLVLVAVGVPLGAAVRRRGDPIGAAAAAGFSVFAVHAGIDWDWEMPVVTLVALGCAAAVLARDPERSTTQS